MSKILVLDDNEILLTVTADMLELDGHEVRALNNAGEFEPILQKETFELLITDIIMPDREGFEIIMYVREKYPEMKIIAITGRDMGESFDILELASGIGADATLKKPFTHEALSKLVGDLLS
jgi:DNA-binding NtrC family response regulator